jgi:hypothetical protein
MAPVRVRSFSIAQRRVAAARHPLPAVAAIIAVAWAATIAVACGSTGTTYTISVVFNDRYTDAGGQAVSDAIHASDAHANVLMQETFPPIARATAHTSANGFCDALRQRLQPRDDIASIDCHAQP